MKTIQTDVLVVGSGFGAAAPALRLSQAGYRVVMIEKGPRIDPEHDFRQTQDPAYITKYLKSLPGDNLNLTYAEGLGGGSGFFEMVTLRAPTIAFQQKDVRGNPLWPQGVDRVALDPWYDLAEAMLHVEQIAPEDVPRTGLVFARMMKALGYSCDRARYAVRGCVGSGFCVTGCVFGAKQSLLLNYIPDAEKAGAEILTGLEARSIRTLDEVRLLPRDGSLRALPHRYEVTCRAAEGTGDSVAVQARIVILGGGTIGTAALLLRSRPTLPLLSRMVGHGIAFNGSFKAAGLLPDWLPDGDLFTGRSHPGIISYEFLDSHGITISAVKPLPLQLMAGARLIPPGADPSRDWWGQKHGELIRQIRTRLMILYAISLTPPLGRLTIDPNGNPRVHLRPSAELSAYGQRVEHLLESILKRSGCRPAKCQFVSQEGVPRPDDWFSTAHQVGSCRMADSPDRGVVAPNGEVFHYPGLYVSDGAAIPSSLAVNTSLTILANAERIADGILKRHPTKQAPGSRDQLAEPMRGVPSQCSTS